MSPKELLTAAEVIYNACRSVKSRWDQLGEVTRSVWVDKVKAGVTPNDYEVPQRGTKENE